jgi:hypothetical protein
MKLREIAIDKTGATLEDLANHLKWNEDMRQEHEANREEYLDPFSEEYQEKYGHLHTTVDTDEDLPF